MLEDIIWRVPDVQERPVHFSSLQHSILVQRAGAEPILNDFAVFAELGSGWELNQELPPTHPFSSS